MSTQYNVETYSTDIFGRVVCTVRHHPFVADGPVQNGCPGEAIMPGELFLSGLACCGVELIQVLAKDMGLPLKKAQAVVEGESGGRHPLRNDLTVFNRVALDFTLEGVTDAEAARLIAAFKGR